MEFAIETCGLKKYFGKIQAVDGIDLKVPKGYLYGVLGPNGAGKSTTIKMLSTVLYPTDGKAIVLGMDLKNGGRTLKQKIGVCPQELVVYPRLTARENIHLIAQMYGLSKNDYKERTDDLLGKMNLLDRANDLSKTFSGGMKRRLNVLMAVIHEPELIFFDEPTAGLDPQSRRVVWDFIKGFQAKDSTIILTTHNMEEADDLSDELVVIDYGKIIAQGTPSDLKGRLGEGDIIEFKVNNPEFRAELIERTKTLDFIRWGKPIGKQRIVLNALDGLRRISEIMDVIKVEMRDISVRENTLEDVFIDITGRRLRN
ncbi:MAG: ATP-binding cassette domain-containing protein [Candidatus Heimdallarchaeota archaeon]|nr:MAG: ATP-binding cassette domain-containing protein [Candidatus Heimdallarchaeota archaeon]